MLACAILSALAAAVSVDAEPPLLRHPVDPVDQSRFCVRNALSMSAHLPCQRKLLDGRSTEDCSSAVELAEPFPIEAADAPAELPSPEKIKFPNTDRCALEQGSPKKTCFPLHLLAQRTFECRVFPIVLNSSPFLSFERALSARAFAAGCSAARRTPWTCSCRTPRTSPRVGRGCRLPCRPSS